MSDYTPDEFVNVDETAGNGWKAETTPYERVRHVIAQTYTSIPAADIAEDALTSPKTARKHLKALADEGFAVTSAGEHGRMTYRRSPESLVVEQAVDILEHASTDELVTRIGEMRDQLNNYRAKYGVNSPEELAVERTNQMFAESESDHQNIDSETVQEWQMLRRNLAFTNAALSIANAERFVDDDLHSMETFSPNLSLFE
ncbi:transcriptional regulator [Halarchaeum grantii]|uniref:Transcriptional regulator n=1 Tax=Halarchaeum grantii TaxID=1193105 RepID=A0A830EYE0_9EURY|nr:Rrf2 family transcriptional regulator [Halarchaeum grantii]GGL44138.1 transcriptional regulator [Halarchaeum grantii]